MAYQNLANVVIICARPGGLREALSINNRCLVILLKVLSYTMSAALAGFVIASDAKYHFPMVQSHQKSHTHASGHDA